MKGSLETAQVFHCQGRLIEAESQYREVLRWQPDAIDALRGLGALAYQRGRLDEAMALFSRGVTIRPDAADLHSNLAEVLRILHRTCEAVEHATKGLALDPTLPDAWNTMGLLAHDQRRLGDAESAFREAIRLRPEHWSAHNNIGTTLQAMGRFDEAAASLRTAIRLEPRSAAALTNLAQLIIEMGDFHQLAQAEELCRRALAIAPELNEAINTLGNVYRLQGRLDDAMSCYQQALRLDPQRAMPCLNMGKLLQERGRFDDAEQWFARAHTLQPDPARYHANLGSLWAARLEFQEAARSYRRAISRDPGLAEAHQGLGVALLEQGQLDEAENCFRTVMRIEPSRPAPWTAIACLSAERGDIELSCQAARRALTLQPNLVDPYIQLAYNLKGRLPDADIEAIESLLRGKHLPDESRSLLLFGLAGVDDARGDFAAAAARLDRANALRGAARRARGDHEVSDEHSRFIDQIVATINPDLIERARGWGDPDPRPVFVVGLPRSGSTLVEQIIATHPKVHGVGELPDVRRVFKGLPELVGRPFDAPCDALLALDQALSRVAARRYLDHLDTLAPPSAVRVIDKMLDNVELLGVIAMLWPCARVIVCHRDVRDVAVSCWQTPFASIQCPTIISRSLGALRIISASSAIGGKRSRSHGSTSHIAPWFKIRKLSPGV